MSKALKAFRWVKLKIQRVFWRRLLCDSCPGCYVASNWGPCYTCDHGSNYSGGSEEAEKLRDRILEDVYHD